MKLIVIFMIIASTSQLELVAQSDNCTCVPYYQCSEDTGYLITDGTGLFDVRGYKSHCTGYFDVCCHVSSTASPVETASNVQKGCGYLKSSFFWTGALLHKELNSKKPSVFKCGVTLINEQTVITAAHCIHPSSGIWTTQIGNANKQVSKIYLHPKFSSGTLQNDLAILILDGPVSSPENLQLLCLPPPGIVLEKSWCSITENNPGSMQNHKKVPIVPKEKCQSLLRNTRLGPYFQLHNSFLCAGGEKNRKSCRGDGGNPLVCPVLGQPGRFHQIGIMSWGIGCGENNNPSVYVNLAMFRDWIDEVMIENNFNINSYRY